MQKNPDQNAIEQAMKLAASPAGKQLLAMLQSSNSETVQKAQQQAAQGDFTQAKNTLADILRSPEVQKIIQEMRQSNG